jgi:uncharacterized protein involved in outer membrane biogenesis
LAEKPRLVLNRLFIVVGALAILLLAAAFLVPGYVPWSNYRANLEAMASEAVGQPVTIAGDIHFTLLPEPHLEFADVAIGKGAAALTVAKVDARFSLLDFLRDRYTITQLGLTQPHISFGIRADGALSMPLPLGGAPSTARVAIAEAEISDGNLVLADARSGDAANVTDIKGSLKLDAASGAIALQGSGSYAGSAYGLRLTTGARRPDSALPLSITLRPASGAYSLIAEGAVDQNTSFDGKVTFRQEPPKAQPAPAKAATSVEQPAAAGPAAAGPAAAGLGQGAFVMAGTVKASTSRLLFSDYTLQPDENRPATRLSGAAELTLGASPSFNAVISGGIVSIPAVAALARPGPTPYGLVDLLSDLPLPAIPSMPGTIGVDITQLDLRGTPLRNLLLDATTDGTAWNVSRFSALLPGNANLQLAGRLTAGPSRGEFAGTLKLTAKRLETVAALWRKPAAIAPLFAVPGSLDAKVNLVGDTLSLSDGALTIGDDTLPFAIELGLASQHELHVNSRLGTLDAALSARLFALLPDLSTDVGFPATFLTGAFDITADAITIADLPARGVKLTGTWEGGVLALSQAEADEIGGAGVAFTATAFGTLARPELSGSGKLTIESPSAPLVTALRDALKLPAPLAAQLPSFFPLELAMKLGAPSGKGGQTLTLSGDFAGSGLTTSVELEQGLLRALTGQLDIRTDIRSDDPARLSAQLGFGSVGLLSTSGSMHVVGRATGHVGNRFQTTIVAEGGGQSLGFSGDIVAPDFASLTGKGIVKLDLRDPAPLLTLFGVSGIAPPGFAATGSLDFEQGKSLKLTDVSGSAGDVPFSLSLDFGTAGARPSVSGKLRIAEGDLSSLFATAAGRAALLKADGSTWLDGPLDLGESARATDGRVAVSIDRLDLASDRTLSNLGFDLAWDANSTSLRNGTASLGSGQIAFDATLCCAGSVSDKSLSLRASVTNAALADLLPPGATATGTLTGSLRLDALGDSLDAAIAAANGEGTFAVTGLSLPQLFVPAVPASVAALKLTEATEADFTTSVETALAAAPLAAPVVSGTLSIASGTVRSPNLAIAGADAQLFGNLTLRLADLALGGSFAARPSSLPPDFPLELPSVELTVAPTGTLGAPTRAIDATALYNALLSKELERQVVEAEKRRAEDEARQQAEAAEAARIAEEQAKAEAARKAAEEKAKAEAASKAKAEAAAKAKAQEQLLTQPLDLGLGN